MMNSKLSWQQFKVLFLVQSLFVLLLTATGRASASGSGIAPNDIKNTTYPVPSGAFFVAPDGKDSNYGQNPNAPTTLAKAIYRAPAGGTIVFRGGIYRNNSKVYIGKKLTLQPYPQEKAWIKGSQVVTGWIANGSIWQKTGWNYSFPSNVSSQYINPKYPLAGYRDMVYIDGVSLQQVASINEVKPGKFYLDSANKQLYIGDNPTGKTVEATAYGEGLLMWKSATSDPSNTVVRGLGFAHFAEQPLIVGAPHITLENNTFAWNGVQGVYLAGESEGVQGVSSDAILRGNTFSHNGRKGLAGSRANRLLLESNTFSYNNQENFAINWDAAGVKLIRSDGLTLRDNLVENNYAAGIWIDISSTNAAIVRNVVHHNSGTGIWFEISNKAIIGANVVYRNSSSGIFVLDSSNVRVYNNTLANNSSNLRVYDLPRKNTNQAEIAAGITWIARNNSFKNNILSNTTGAELFEAWNCDTKELSSLLITMADYDAYYRTSASAPSSVISWVPSADKCRIVYPTIAAFNSATGYEPNALVIDNVATNPFFIDEVQGNFSLKTGSPAIGRGEELPADVAQAIGWSSGVKVDLGALQATGN